MAARQLSGRPVAEAIWANVEARVATYIEEAGRAPAVALVGGGNDAADAYGRQIERQFARHGLAVERHDVDPTALGGAIARLNRADAVDGIVLLTPLPTGVDTNLVVQAIDPAKDVDGQHPTNLGHLVERKPLFVPATAQGGLELLRYYQVPLKGARVTVVGRSPVVGMPLALLLVGHDATVTICHTRTVQLPAVTREADILCVAAGRAGLIGAEHVKPGAVVIDFGTNPGPDGALVGDVQAAAVADIADGLTPVPGGTGPTTVAVLARQTLDAAERHHGRR